MSYRIKGFSLFELLVVMALLGVVISFIVISYRSSYLTNSLSTSVYEVSNTLRNASVYSRDQKDNSSWGVKSSGPNSYLLLTGSSDSPKTIETKRTEQGTEFGKQFEVWFEKGTGYTVETEIVLNNKNTKEAKILVLSTGLVEENI